jgi:adenosylcobinamide kinase/adenosylcobinamide-phosphate guanylyltransferase
VLTLIGGGARSGKSSYALNLGDVYLKKKRKAVFVATAQPIDEEMIERINRHKAERDDRYQLIEEPRNLSSALATSAEADLVIVDCLTLWLSNVLAQNQEPNFDEVLQAARAISGDIFFVTNETGEGIVPIHPIAREFRDFSGRMNAIFAKECDQVIAMKFGIPMKLKVNQTYV